MAKCWRCGSENTSKRLTKDAHHTRCADCGHGQAQYARHPTISVVKPSFKAVKRKTHPHHYALFQLGLAAFVILVLAILAATIF